MTEIDNQFEFKFKKYASFDKSHQDSYDNLKKQRDSFLYGQDMTKTFILSMALGFYKNNPKKISNPSNSIPTSVFTTEEKWMMISLYMHTKRNKLDSLYEADDILRNAEEYANGGIEFLYMLYKNSKNPIEDLEEEFRLALE